MSRHPAELNRRGSFLEEEPRLQVPRIFRDETIRSMGEAVKGCPVDLSFNLHDVGISDLEDCTSKKVVVSTTVTSQLSGGR